MALSSVADVLRLMNQSGTIDAQRDADIATALQAAEGWVRQYLGWNPDQTGTQTLKYYDYREDSILAIPLGSSVSAVRTFFTADSPGTVLTNLTDYEVQDESRVRLRMETEWPSIGNDGWGESDWPGPERLPSVYYSRIEIDVLLDNSCVGVPQGIVDGTAIIAGALIQRAAAEMQGITSETIGGYSYSLGGSVLGTNSTATWIPRSALTFLKPYRKRKSVFVP